LFFDIFFHNILNFGFIIFKIKKIINIIINTRINSEIKEKVTLLLKKKLKKNNNYHISLIIYAKQKIIKKSLLAWVTFCQKKELITEK